MNQDHESTEIVQPQDFQSTEIIRPGAASEPPPSLPRPAATTSGPAIDGYDSFSELGKGGFATVYRARQSALGREVAVKVLHRSADDDAALASFRRESHLVADLSWHPHVAPVLEAGTTETSATMGRHPYLCFQLVEHGSLEDQIERNGPLNWVAATRAAIEVADALAAAHAIGVIHRDIKTANVLVDRLGRGQLADFGIASLVGERDEGGIAMTVAHAPPELFEGRSASPQSDIYSLGSMLYELLAGRPAYERLNGEPLAPLIERIVSTPVPPLPQTAAPASIAQVIAAAMAKVPDHRFASAIEFGRALQRAQSQASLELTPMPYCDLMAPHTSSAPDRSQLLVRPPTARLASSSGPTSRPRLGGWIIAGCVALGLACGVAGGIVLVDRLGNDTSTVAESADAQPAETVQAESEQAEPSDADPATDPPDSEPAAGSASNQDADIVSITASATSPPLTLADGSELVLSAADMVDGDRSTSWLVPGDGAGVVIQLDLGSAEAVASVGLVPGFSGIDPVNGAERFGAVRRIATVRWTFDDGSTVEQSFVDLDDLQRMAIEPTSTRTIRLEVLSTTEPGTLDFTAISELGIEVNR
ncbi:MAG: protein kinase [Ilumatobacter sp.]